MSRRPASRARRIAIVTHALEFGGGVTVVARWLRESLESLGSYSVGMHNLATSSRDPWSRRLVVPGTWLRPSLMADSAGSQMQHWGANAVELEVMRYRPRRELTNILRQYDLVQVVSGSPAWASAVAGSGLPVVLQVATMAAWERASQFPHWPVPLRTWRKAMTRLTSRLDRSSLRNVDAVLAENTAMLEYARAMGQARVVKAPPGIDTRTFSPPTDGWRRTGHLLSVCRLGDPRKGLDRMILAYAEMLSQKGTLPPLVLVGLGTVPQPALSLIEQLGLTSRVVIRSNLDRVQLVETYRGASVFLQASYEEGLGLSVMEAMSCGLPVVATQTHGARELVVHGSTGWLVPQTRGTDVPRVVAERVLDVLEGDGATLGAQGRSRCQREFSSEVALRRFTDVYDDVLHQRGRRGGTGQPTQAGGERMLHRRRANEPLS